MNKQKQQGYSLIVIIMSILFSSLILLYSINSRISEQLYLYSDEMKYIQAYTQARSALQWGLAQHWPMTNNQWHCLSHSDPSFSACLKLTHEPDIALLKGTSQPLAGEQPISVFQWVLMTPLADANALYYLQKKEHGWLDFCPEKNKPLCD